MSKCEHGWLLSDSQDTAVCWRCGAKNDDYSSLRAAEARLRSGTLRLAYQHPRGMVNGPG